MCCSHFSLSFLRSSTILISWDMPLHKVPYRGIAGKISSKWENDLSTNCLHTATVHTRTAPENPPTQTREAQWSNDGGDSANGQVLRSIRILQYSGSPPEALCYCSCSLLTRFQPPEGIMGKIYIYQLEGHGTVRNGITSWNWMWS